MSSIPARSPVCLLGSEAPSSLTLSAYLRVFSVCSHDDMLGLIIAIWDKNICKVKIFAKIFFSKSKNILESKKIFGEVLFFQY